MTCWRRERNWGRTFSTCSIVPGRARPNVVRFRGQRQALAALSAEWTRPRFPDQGASWPATLTRHRHPPFPWEGQRGLLAIRPSDEGRQLEHLSPEVLDLLS